jgi:heptosyltransferase-2
MVHLAEAAGTDVFAIFGPTVKEFGFFPYRENSKVFETNIWCRPCSRHGSGKCFRHERYCLTKIDPESIADEIIRRVANREKGHYGKVLPDNI